MVRTPEKDNLTVALAPTPFSHNFMTTITLKLKPRVRLNRDGGWPMKVNNHCSARNLCIIKADAQYLRRFCRWEFTEGNPSQALKE